MNNIEFFKQVLCPPGDGVFTVETGKEKKAKVQKALFGESAVLESWLSSLSNLDSKNLPILLGVPSDNGGGILRGANWGPLFIRELLIENPEANYFDLGDIRVVPHLLHDSYLNEETIDKVRKALYQNSEDLPVSPLSISEVVIEKLLCRNKKILSLGGDHSISAGLVPPFIKKYSNLGILHFDAHTDLLEERLGIDRCFATWAAQILPMLTSSKNLVQVGIRRSGQTKEYWEKKFGVNQYWAEEVVNKGPSSISKSIIDNFKAQKIEKIYISFDIDAIDEEYASATGTPESGGLRPHEATSIIQALASQFEVVGADLVEVAPYINHYGSRTKKSPEPETTLDVASQVALKLLEALS